MGRSYVLSHFLALAPQGMERKYILNHLAMTPQGMGWRRIVSHFLAMAPQGMGCKQFLNLLLMAPRMGGKHTCYLALQWSEARLHADHLEGILR